MVQPAGQAGEYGIDQAIAAIGALAASALEGASFRQLAELPKEYLQIATDFVSKEQHNYEFIFTKNDICQIALNAYKFIEEKKGDNEVSRRAIAMRVVCEIPRFALYKRARIKAGDPHYPDQKVVIDLQGNSCSLRDFLNQYDQSMEELTKNGKEFVLSYQTFYGIVSSTLKRELQKYGKTPHLIMIRYIALKMYLIAACKRPVLLHSCSYQQAFEQLLCDMCANPAMDLEKAIYLLKP